MSDLSRIGREVGRLAGGRGRRYPARLKQRIVRAVREARGDGQLWSVISEELGVPIETLRRWLPDEDDETSEMRQVVIAEPFPLERRDVVVVTPAGYRIEGLDVEGAAALVRTLSP